MPALNAEMYISEAIRSVLSQSVRDIELVVVDDGSTDRSAEVVKAIDDPRIRLIREEQNRGVSSALDRGIQEAGSDTIAVIGADDVYGPTKLEEQLQVYRDKTVVYTGWFRIGEDSRREYSFLRMHEGSFATYLARGRHGILLASMMFSKAEAQRVGCYDRSLRIREDTDFAFKLFESGNRFIGIPKPLYGYRFVPQSLSAVGGRQSHRVLYDLILRHRKVIDMNDEDVRMNLAKCMIATRNFKSAARWTLLHPTMIKVFYQAYRDPGRMERAFQKSKQYENGTHG